MIEQSSEDFILLQTLQPIESGQVFEKIPPHMTMLSWFALFRQQLDSLVPLLDQLAGEHGADTLKAVGTERALFGLKEDIPACKLKIGTYAIHDTVLEWVIHEGGSFKYPSYARDLQPHITDEGGVSIQPGQEITFSSLVLFSRQDTPIIKRKVAEYSIPLGVQR